MVVLFKLAFFAIFSKMSLICLIDKFIPFQLLSYVELLNSFMELTISFDFNTLIYVSAAL